LDFLLKAAEIKITKDFGGFSSSNPIEGSPFSSIRVRSVSSFGYTLKAIQDHFKGKNVFDLTVIEANLSRMPSTVKQLPPIYTRHKKFIGSYISPSFSNYITFYDEKELSGKDRKQKIQLLTQKTPFILIDISPSVEVEQTDKEWVVLSGYRDFLYDKSINKEELERTNDFNAFADLYAIKRHLYLGWPFEEVSLTLLEHVSNFQELINGINLLVEVSSSLEKEGYQNPSKIPYYLTFKINPKTFPIDLESMMKDDKTFNPFYQLKNFMIIEYDQNSNFITIETPAFISPDLCHKILKSINRPLITKYNSATNTIDVKSQDGTYQEY
jgi:hypothetical protein